jgi:hypothetical protein
MRNFLKLIFSIESFQKISLKLENLWKNIPLENLRWQICKNSPIKKSALRSDITASVYWEPARDLNSPERLLSFEIFYSHHQNSYFIATNLMHSYTEDRTKNNKILPET